jgi:hypothetical protein
MRHATVRKLLYDYLTDALPAEERFSVERHCGSCARCAAQRDALQRMLNVDSRHEASPADERPEEFWDAFAQRVESSITARGKPSRPAWAYLIDEIERTIQIQWRTAAGFAGALTIFAVAFAVWKLAPPAPPPDRAERITARAEDATLANARVHQYFRKSKVLFVGLTNMETPEGQQVDLTAERQASRELIREARYLRQQPLDTRSSELVDQLERILIELANMERQADLPNVEMIRSGIHQENLLFKIRMTQALYEPAKHKQPSTTHQRIMP